MFQEGVMKKICVAMVVAIFAFGCGCEYDHGNAVMTYHVDSASSVQIQYLLDGEMRTAIVNKEVLPWTASMLVDLDGDPVYYGMTVTALAEPYNVYVMVDVDGETVSGGWWFAQQEVSHWMYWCPPGCGECATIEIGVEGGK